MRERPPARPVPHRSSGYEAFVLAALAALACLAVWHVAVVVTRATVFPSPPEVARGITQLVRKGVLWSYIADSLFRVACGYLAAVLIGVPLGLALGWWSSLARAANPLIQMLRPISPLAWMPLAVIWFGISDLAPIFLIFLASVFPILLSAMNAVRNVPSVYVQVARNFGLHDGALLGRVILPAVLPGIVAGLRLAFGVAWLVLVAAEMIAVDSGLGYLIIDARNAGKRYDLVVGGMLLIGVIGLVLDLLIRKIETLRLVSWAFRE